MAILRYCGAVVPLFERCDRCLKDRNTLKYILSQRTHRSNSEVTDVKNGDENSGRTPPRRGATARGHTAVSPLFGAFIIFTV
jgi:hypothetical protein